MHPPVYGRKRKNSVLLVAGKVTVLTPLAVTGEFVTGSQLTGLRFTVYWSAFVAEAGQLRLNCPPETWAFKVGAVTI